MRYSLPPVGENAIPLTHFPTKQQAFIFRACEYVPLNRIAEILKTDTESVRIAARDMGLPDFDPGELWLKRGYITIIRRMWHILPYDQLLELLETDEQALARIMREEDFLDVKLGEKPKCEKVLWRALTDDEKEKTKEIKKTIQALDLGGKRPFAFEYNIPSLKFSGKEIFQTRMIYAFSGLYQHAFDVDSTEFLPDAQLEAYRNLGINGIWTQGVLSQLSSFPFDPAVSSGYLKRLGNMRALTERLRKYGIKLYLYLNEPRSMPSSFFDGHPEIKGHKRGDDACLCISTEAVKNYLKDSIEAICRAVPLIGGFFIITRSENLTNCYSHADKDRAPCSCPRCKERSVGEVIADTVGCILEGARRVSKDIKLFAWSWRWDEYNEEVISCLPKDVILLSQSELDIPFDIGGVKGNVLDYSMSICGPGDYAKNEWKLAKKYGLKTGAKVQINTTWEASTVPAIPVSPLIEAHMETLRNEGVEHLLLSWTLGGYPSRNIVAAAKYFYEDCCLEDEEADTREAQIQLSRAFAEFPFHIGVLYFGPQNAGPSNLLFENSTGYSATMTCFAYDDLEHWRGIYPVEVFEAQFEKLCRGWKLGLDMLSKSKNSDLNVMAEAAYCLFRSSLNQIRFVRSRNEGRFKDAALAAEDELSITRKMLVLMSQNAAIGYEAANHYYFSKGQLAEKILNCRYVINALKNK